MNYVINVARILDEISNHLGDCQRSGTAIRINHQTYKALANSAVLQNLTIPRTVFGLDIEMDEQLADGAYELKQSLNALHASATGQASATATFQ